MPEPSKPSPAQVPPRVNPSGQCDASSKGEKVICERCGEAEMFRMHAVWRCPNCGYKTDCCGW